MCTCRMPLTQNQDATRVRLDPTNIRIWSQQRACLPMILSLATGLLGFHLWFSHVSPVFVTYHDILWMVAKSCTRQGNYWDSYETRQIMGLLDGITIYPAWCRISLAHPQGLTFRCPITPGASSDTHPFTTPRAHFELPRNGLKITFYPRKVRC